MTFEQLLYTLELAKHRTLGEAADVLHISKSGLSQTISQLEAELNTTIFERTHDGTSLTVAGGECQIFCVNGSPLPLASF
ncbi:MULTISPECIES: LysR family transcriptional regulator [Levilactobacillus]|uniref:LysR family transcriptional regulator n=1 Tax=Levilactobacillus TaxID=2767886 RepID=UPI0037568654